MPIAFRPTSISDIVPTGSSHHWKIWIYTAFSSTLLDTYDTAEYYVHHANNTNGEPVVIKFTAFAGEAIDFVDSDYITISYDSTSKVLKCLSSFVYDTYYFPDSNLCLFTSVEMTTFKHDGSIENETITNTELGENLNPSNNVLYDVNEIISIVELEEDEDIDEQDEPITISDEFDEPVESIENESVSITESLTSQQTGFSKRIPSNPTSWSKKE